MLEERVNRLEVRLARLEQVNGEALAELAQKEAEAKKAAQEAAEAAEAEQTAAKAGKAA